MWHWQKARESKGTTTVLPITSNLVGKDSQMVLEMGWCLMLKRKVRKRVPAAFLSPVSLPMWPRGTCLLSPKPDDQLNTQHASKTKAHHRSRLEVFQYHWWFKHYKQWKVHEISQRAKLLHLQCNFHSFLPWIGSLYLRNGALELNLTESLAQRSSEHTKFLSLNLLFCFYSVD